MSKPIEQDSMSMQSHLIEGTFGEKAVRSELFTLKKNPRLVVNLHAAFGTIHGSDLRYRRFAEFIKGEKLSNVVLFQSSRLETESGLTELQFKGKTLEQEVEDARRVITYYTANSDALFGVAPEKVELTLHGNSLGGLIALLLAGEFGQVANIVTVGTGLEGMTDSSGKPLLSEIPIFLKKIREGAGNFRGRAMVQFGSDDDVIVRKSFFELHRILGSEEKNKDICEFKGVNHSFTRLNGQPSTEPYDQVSRDLKSVLSGIIPGGMVFLTHESEHARRRAELEERTKGLVSAELHPLDPEN